MRLLHAAIRRALLLACLVPLACDDETLSGSAADLSRSARDGGKGIDLIAGGDFAVDSAVPDLGGDGPADLAMCASSCPNGCCVANVCRAPTAMACGTGGAACMSCDNKADNCAGGACACGLGSVCGNSQECVAGRCVCSPASCPNGCCSGATCAQPQLMSCGLLGRNCAQCDPKLANGCVNGACACAMGARC